MEYTAENLKIIYIMEVTKHVWIGTCNLIEKSKLFLIEGLIYKPDVSSKFSIFGVFQTRPMQKQSSEIQKCFAVTLQKKVSKSY